MAAVAVKRSVQATCDVLTIASPDYRFVVRVPHDHGPARILSLQRGDMLSPESMQAVEHQRRIIRERIRDWWARWFIPRIIRLCPTCGGGTATEEVRVTLPQMVQHRASVCGVCDIRRRWLVFFCGRPGIPQWRIARPLHWLIGKRKAPGCGCLLWLKQRLAGADCPAGKWIEQAVPAA